jgi:hypothetical protein
MSTYQKKIIKEYESNGYGVIKLSKTNKNGIADLLVSKPSERPKLIEVKEKKDTLKPLQVAQNRLLSVKMGFDFIVIQDGKGIINTDNINYLTDLF